MVEHTGKTGVITSILYPEYIYTLNGLYAWRITVELGKVIAIDIDNCILKRSSKVNVYDGIDNTATLLRTLEVDDISKDQIVSTSSTVYIEFSIVIFSESKFKFVWNEIFPRNERSENVTNSLNCTENSLITVQKGSLIDLKSPGFPQGYDTAQHCKWTFVPLNPGFHVALTFLTIDLEASQDCVADYVTVSTGNDLTHFETKAQLCSYNHTLPVLYHGTPNVRVEFISDYSNNRSGFEALVLLKCGGILSENSGVISSAMLRRENGTTLLSNSTCEWSINVRRGRKIQFTFDTFRLTKRADGSCDSYIIIKNGFEEDAPFLGIGKYCGSSMSVLDKTISNKAVVVYVRGTFMSDDNFEISYRQVEHECGGTFTITSDKNETIITTPNYPNIPHAYIECVWRILAPNGELLKVSFIERFDLTSSKNCTSEYLEIRDGSTSGAEVLGKFCSDILPGDVYTTSNIVRLKYFTDVPIPRNGFKIKITIARCGGSYNALRGYIMSEKYPGLG